MKMRLNVGYKLAGDPVSHPRQTEFFASPVSPPQSTQLTWLYGYL